MNVDDWVKGVNEGRVEEEGIASRRSLSKMDQ